MLLRASGEHNGQAIDLDTVIGKADGDGGIPDGALLIAFAEAVVGDDDAALAVARKAVLDALGAAALVDACGVAATFKAVLDALGAAALVDACGVAATFNAIDRVADSTGIPIDEKRIEPSAGLRESLGIDRFPSRLQG